MDISSEMIHALLPVYMVAVLGTSAFAVGLIEGVAEATAAITKVFSGALSDWLAQAKAACGPGLRHGCVDKARLSLGTIAWLAGGSTFHRPRRQGHPRRAHALIADISPKEIRGASFGLRQSLDTVGAFLGPALALVLMWWTADHYSTVFWIAVIPAFCSVAIILFVVKEPQRTEQRRIRVPFHRSELVQLPAIYWLVVAVSAVFTLARFSEAFLILDAQQMRLPVMFVPVVLIVMNISYGLSAYPAGVMADRVDRITLLIVGLVLLVLADLSLALLPGLAGLGIGVLLWGLHMGFTQGLLAALVAGCRTRRTARNRLRHLQPDCGYRASRSERACRCPLGLGRTPDDLLHRRGLRFARRPFAAAAEKATKKCFVKPELAIRRIG